MSQAKTKQLNIILKKYIIIYINLIKNLSIKILSYIYI